MFWWLTWDTNPSFCFFFYCSMATSYRFKSTQLIYPNSVSFLAPDAVIIPIHVPIMIKKIPTEINSRWISLYRFESYLHLTEGKGGTKFLFPKLPEIHQFENVSASYATKMFLPWIIKFFKISSFNIFIVQLIKTTTHIHTHIFQF